MLLSVSNYHQTKMAAHPKVYQLPSSAEYKCLDRFSLHPTGDEVEDVNGNVPLWPILEHLLSQPVTCAVSLIDLLETICVTVHSTVGSAGDHGLLRRIVEARSNSFFAACWPRLVQVALQLPELFPSGYIPILNDYIPPVMFTRRQAACLVIHQFLRTLRAPEWRHDGTHDFGIWYSSEQRQESAALAYLEALFVYFDQVVYDESQLDDPLWMIQYDLRSTDQEEMIITQSCPLANIEIAIVDKYDLSPKSLALPGGAAVISANKYIGFGQSATQEEVHVGTSPEACPAVLITPPLTDNQALIVKGAQAMINITGQRRDIAVEAMSLPEGGLRTWRERTMLFMDALELDMVDVQEGALPDLIPGNTDREIKKAFTAFSSARYGEVRTGIWGCGAFCGDPAVKTLLLWIAASLAGVKLVVVCDYQNQVTGTELQGLVSKVKDRLGDVQGILKLLENAPRGLLRFQTAPEFEKMLEASDN